MKNKKNEKKRDIEAKLFIKLLHLKEEKKKEYSLEECEKNVVYVFENYEEFKNYFLLNGFVNISDDLLELCIMKITKKGTIISLKGLCDYTIRQHNLNESQNNENQQFDVLEIPCSRAFVVSPEKAEEFKNLKPNPEVRQQMEEISEQFRVNNLAKEGPVLKKTRKPNENN